MQSASSLVPAAAGQSRPQSAAAADPDAGLVAARYLILGQSEPGLLPRLLEPFAKLGLCPARVHASSEAGDGSVVSVDLRLVGVSERTAELVEANLRRVIGVHQLIAAVDRMGA